MIEKIDITKEVKPDIKIKDHLYNMDDVNKKLNDFLTGRIPKGFNIGVDVFDTHFSFKKNEFYVLTGKKGSGKTSINQAIQILGSIVNGLIWVVAFQENDKWAMKLNYMNYLLGEYANDVLKTNKDKFNVVSNWIDKHFIFLKVTSMMEATEVTKQLIEKRKINVFGLLLDPINSFKTGWKDTGNTYSDGVDASLRLLQFSLDYCSVFVNQHPTMSGQRQQEAVTSYQGEGGWFLNKASFTYVINREKGSNENELIIENVRNKHTGGQETEKENPVILEWFPTKINIYYRDGGFVNKNIVQTLIQKHRPFNYKGMDEEMGKVNNEDFNDIF